MFVRQLNRRFAAVFSGDREREKMTLEAARAIVRDSARVRCRDYVFNFSTDTGRENITLTTTANWCFILCNASCFVYPEFAAAVFGARVTIEDRANARPVIAADMLDADYIPAALVFGKQGGQHFEEYKNLYWLVGDRANITLDIAAGGQPARGAVILTGVEIDTAGV